MSGPLRSFASVIACLLAAWQPSSAFAQDEDVQLWVYAVASGDVGDDTRLTVDASLRWREQARGDEQQTLRFNIEQMATKGVWLGGGFGVFETEGGDTELRPHQQLSLTRGRFSARTRFEQRFFDVADRVELRVRQRLRYTQPLGRQFSAIIDGEFLHLVQTRRRDPLTPRDQWRGALGLSRRLGENLSFGASYLVIYTPGGEVSDRINHVPQATVTYRF